MNRRRQYLVLLVLFAGTCAYVMAQVSDDELAEQRNRYEIYRKYPERLAKLRGNYQVFQSQAETRQEAIRKLDAELHSFGEKKKARYWGVLERYADWLDELKQRNPKAYQAIRSAPDSATRLALVKTERDREWMQTQPKAYREQWAALQEDARTEFIANLRREERQTHLRWQIAARFWSELEKKQFLPSRLSDFARKAKGKDAKTKDGKFKDKEINRVQDYVTNYLMPFLSDAEKKQLAEAEGRWPDYPQTLVEIARKRPSALPPMKNKEEYFPTMLKDLPAPIQDRIADKKGGAKAKSLKDLRTFEKGPGFAGKAVEIGTNNGNFPFEYEFWPSHFKGLLKPMQQFVASELIPKLNTKDKKDLEDHSGRWPYYPKKIQELAKKYQLQPPWHILPEADIWHWDRYRKDRPKSAAVEKSKEDAEP